MEKTEREEEYLEEIRRAEEDGKKCTTTFLAKKLKISPASVSEMLKKLKTKGYIEYSPYGNVQLTDYGRDVGKQVLDKHRVAEEFLLMLGLDETEIHEEACRIEHALSDRVFAALSDFLKNCDKISPLSEMGEGETGVIVRIDTDAICRGRGHGRGYGCAWGALKRLSDLGFTPKTVVVVKRKAPLSGPVEVEIRGTTVCISQNYAKGIIVRKTEG
ncbi:MAG: metal-dependent transcriptional regulator [Thermoplasmata archaeon]|nr:metal-dependent transcriptional regulator [Thermoplasmata archaeon]